MKTLPLILLFVVLTSCGQKTIKVTNSSDIPVSGKPFVISRSHIARLTGDSLANDVLFARLPDGKWLPSQCDDLDGDGKWDELAFLCDLKPDETIKIRFEKPDSNVHFPVRTNIRFGRMTKPFEEVSDDFRLKTNDTKFSAPVYQMEGPAWENDMIAFRNYFDARNGIDIFGKMTTEMVMDSVGVNGREYHSLHEWGMDILKVGNSLGAGAIAIGIGDSLYRIGPCKSGRYRLISEGPVRSVLVLSYIDVPAGGRLYQVVHRISIFAGEHFYRSQVWVHDLKGDETLVTGIVNLHNVPARNFQEGDMNILYSLGKQGISGEVLGMGVIVPESSFVRYWEAPDSGSAIVNTHLVSLKIVENIPSEYRFAAMWENRDPQVKDKAYFEGVLKESAVR